MPPFVRRLPVLCLTLLAASAAGCGPPQGGLTLDQALDSLSLETFSDHLETLSDDAMGGRQPGTPGYDSAAAYVAREAGALGLRPGGVAGSWFQPITFRRASVDPASVSLSVAGRPLRFGPDVSLSPRIQRTEVAVEAPLVFAGFGISAPDLGYDDLEGLDLEGRLAVVIQGAPEGFTSVARSVLPSAAVRDRELLARGALGVVTVAPEGPESRRAWPETSRRVAAPRVGYLEPGGGAGEGRELPVSLAVSQRVAAEWLAGAGRDFDRVHRRLRAGEPVTFDLGVVARVEARFEHESFESANVAALLPGTDPALAGAHLVLTAHLDHVGTGFPVEGDSIYNGTLDNASGSAALLTLASVLTRMEPPRRPILFLWVTAEESGLLGAEYFARFPTVGAGRVAANQNIDGVMGMIAAATDVLAFGYEHSTLSDAVDWAVARTGTPVSPDPTPEENLFVRSDQYAFVREGVPAIWVQSGRTAADPGVDAQAELDAWIAERYHRPSDDPDQPMDLAGVRSELEANLLVTWYVANQMDEIRWRDDSFLYRRFAAPGR